MAVTELQTLDERSVQQIVSAALAEDVGSGDRTTEATVPRGARCRASIVLEEPGVACGIPVAAAVFRALDPDLRLAARLEEGATAETVPVALAEVEGSARAVLTGERAALNLVGRLCGIATLTRRYVDAVAGTGTGTRILDTRKTTPGLRALERYAVRCGGGVNHRFGLHDAVLVKENHIRLAGGITAAVEAVGETDVLVEVEAETLVEVEEALAVGVGRILLDNMSPAEVADAVAVVAGRAELEASGGITLDSVRAFAETGVDFISVGALTHGARSLHVSLEVE